MCPRTHTKEKAGHATRQQPTAHKLLYQRSAKEKDDTLDLRPSQSLDPNKTADGSEVNCSGE